MDKGTNLGTRPGDAAPDSCDRSASPGRVGRMSRQRKTAAVLRLLRGEDLDLVSRSLGVTAARLTGWRDAFLAAGEGIGKRPAEGPTWGGADRAGPVEREDRHPRGEAPFGPTEAQVMSRATSPVNGKRYGLARVCRIWRLARSGVYRRLTCHQDDVGQGGRCPTMI